MKANLFYMNSNTQTKKLIVTSLDILRTPSTNIEEFDEVLDKMLRRELALHETGVGLASIQIGVAKRMVLVRMNSGEIKTFWNFYIKKASHPRTSVEGCLSIPNKLSTVLRWQNIVVENGDGQEINLTGMEAIIAQHEADHCDGILCTDSLGNSEGI